ncbi:MAG: superoxide dismutase [Rickettsiales bacterium]|jgi:Fe-Mn family superoxide dismutase|nr:superoxide dismutase [Rickettsiales bacterium]
MFELKQFPLTYPAGALAPYISENALNFHYGKHLAAYINNLNALSKGTPFEGKALLEIISESAKSPATQGIFNNAAQAFNHDFFFKCLAKDKDAEFPPKLAKAFGTREKFDEAFKAAANSTFGSGWVWLVKTGGEYKIVKTANADTPVAHGEAPLLTLDLWEHAYYLDYQNRRADYVEAYLTHLIDWDFVAENI